MESCNPGWRIVSVACVLVLAVFLGSVSAQGPRQTSYSPASVLRPGRLDLAPSNPLRMPRGIGGPRGSDSLYLSSDMFTDILGPLPNLQVEYLYSFGNDRVDTGRLTLDYLLPLSLGPHSVLFGEVHGEFIDFWKTVQGLVPAAAAPNGFSSYTERTDLSFGGGYRVLLNPETLVGINGFFDTTKLGDRWYESGGIGLEFAALLSGSDALDLSFNWYGDLFNRNVLVNAFRRGPSNFDLELGYSHELFDNGPDLRLHATGYRFEAADGIYGWRCGVEIKSRDGMFSLEYEAGEDKLNRTYHTIGGYVNTGFRLERLLSGRSPFTLPVPIFRSPRNLRRLLSVPVRRDYHQAAAVVAAKSTAAVPCDGFNLITVTAPDSGTYDRQVTSGPTWMLLGTGGSGDMQFTGNVVVPVASICPEGVARILVTVENQSQITATGVQVRVSVGKSLNQYILSRSSVAQDIPAGGKLTLEIIAPDVQGLLRARNISPESCLVWLRHHTGPGTVLTFAVSSPADVVIQFNYH